MAIWDNFGSMLGIRSPEESQYAHQLSQLASGQGPSAARTQLGEGLAQTQRNSQAMAGSDPTNRSLAMRNALLANEQASAQTNQQTAQLRAQEQMNAIGQLGQYAQQKNQANARLMGAVLGGVGSGMAGAGLGAASQGAGALGLSGGHFNPQQGASTMSGNGYQPQAQPTIAGAQQALSAGQPSVSAAQSDLMRSNASRLAAPRLAQAGTAWGGEFAGSQLGTQRQMAQTPRSQYAPPAVPFAPSNENNIDWGVPNVDMNPTKDAVNGMAQTTPEAALYNKLYRYNTGGY